MKTLIKLIVLGRDPGYYASYALCPSRWTKFRRWAAFRLAVLPNPWRPWAEDEAPHPDGGAPGSLTRTSPGTGVGGSNLRYIRPGERIIRS